MPDENPTEFPRAIGRPATRALTATGRTTYASLTEVTAQQLLALHGVGPKAVRVLTEELAARGLAFAPGA
ncbi:hypothetical protein ACFYTF_24815 [Nocardia thailandica]|uniref:DNA-binding protein n=1 Tax=Nocardia thailandica TaxID=257275 RepID=A0ABW6PUI4_9NOCA